MNERDSQAVVDLPDLEVSADDQIVEENIRLMGPLIVSAMFDQLKVYAVVEWEVDITYYGLKMLSWTRLIWGLKPVPQSIMEEAARADHVASIAAAQHAAHAHPEFSSLKKVMPAAAAIAVATATSQITMPQKAEGPVIHKDVAGMTAPSADQSQPPPRVI